MTDATELEGNTALVEEQPNYLSMSDEDILKMDVDSMHAPTEPAEEEEEEEADLDESQVDPPAKEGADAGNPPVGDQPEGGETGAAPDAGKTSKEEGEPGKEAPATVIPDYKQFYDELTAPLKANGKDYQFDSVEDLRRLASMGLNYNKKMGAMKPHLKTLKLLESNGLLDEKKLSFYIDVEKKDPAAIAKLLKDSGIDPRDLDLETNDYKANTYAVDDREIDLDQVLDELKDSSTHYTEILETVSKKWDKASKTTIADNPGILHIINDHMASGVYEVIADELERRRVLGGLRGVSDLEAYKQVGDELNAKGGFNHLFPASSGNGSPTPAVEVPAKPKAEDPSRDDKKRAARSTQAAIPTPPRAADFNPLSMSDDEFEKQFSSKLM